ncbi:large subunit ribosomal protein L25 [Evansella caseinilytica]|uniref:Large ribosomal subunit protein bL25 n=1 Tax=Evansella caseinilytica TaxID=1503961 RepID=A0A1H3UVZ8_9BACI|nr:50S ribosomal protein L25/general stress protein Ctc [Evansella caseinilytica]SDZ66436.1 large subunit ribosomal protein L25 [Evansella caseinilytica]
MTVLQAAKRSGRRGSQLTRIRNEGGVPAVIYGKAFGNEPVTVDEAALQKTLKENGKNGVFKLDLNGRQTDVMIYNIQSDTLKNEILHVDFYAVDMKSEIDVAVPVTIVGEAAGVKNGGVLQQALFEVSVRALPADIPESLEVDVSALDINETLQVKDIAGGDKFQINNEPEEVLLSILPPAETPEEAPQGDEPEAAAEPEMKEETEEG